MGGDTKTVQESGLSSPEMKKAAGTIGTMLNDNLKAGVKPYDQSMVPALSGQTQAGIGALTNNPNTGIFNAGITGALQDQANVAAGNFGNDPMRARVLDDALTGANSVFTASGRFGSGSHASSLAEGAASALGQYDMARQQQGIQNLGSLYQSSMMPASANLQAGSLMDAYNTALAQDNARRFDATQNKDWNTLQRGASIFAGTAPVSGTTQTSTVSQPWWVAPTAIAGTLGSAFF